MLNTLSNLDPRTAQGILANLALGMMPDSGIGSSASITPIDPDLREQLVRELRIKLRLKRDDDSPKALAKLYAALADEMKGIALQGEDLNKIKARLGQQGILSPSQYKIKFAQPFRDTAEQCGVSQYQAESVIRNPDSYEHLIPEHFGFDPNQASSLFMKVEKQTSHSERYIVLVFANRTGYVQEVINAWRVYPSDVDLRDSSSPTDVLKAFVERFGTTFKLGEKTGKLFTHERLSVKHKTPGENSVELLKTTSSTAGDLTYLFSAGRKNSEMIEAVLSFSIDYKEYTESLRTHGVKVNIENLKSRIGLG